MKDEQREGRRAERKERAGMRVTSYACGNKWFFNVRQSIHLLKYCLIG